MKQLYTFLLLALQLTVLCEACSQPAKQIPADEITAMAVNFLHTLSAEQTKKATYTFESDERYNWHYIPKSRKGISLNELNETQQQAAFELLRACLSDTGYNKTREIILLEGILKMLENRSAGDNTRDTGSYYFTLFGTPAPDNIWGWRFEGHHLSFNFSTDTNRLLSGTPSFMGANPAIVPDGKYKGMQPLKDETNKAFALLHSLDEQQKSKAIFSEDAPREIITGADRQAQINDRKRILFSALNAAQQQLFIDLLNVYIDRYTELYAKDLMNEVQHAGMENLRFAWAGAQQPGAGHYYRIHGPTILIEYDNTQNNANHVHTIIRDLQHDFGGDELLEHYRQQH